MKISTSRNVDNQLGSIETHRVNIAANGKAFAALVSGIYENKIRAFVREISTNALDAHIQAGIPEMQFHVDLPDIFDPYFRVRDYGVSMTHDKVFDIFGTLFASDKDQSNDVVGAFGLGSKSPLSYADSFEVTAHLDGEVRTYLVTIDDTGAPLISLLAKADTDKPNGVEVAVPIRENDIARVIAEAKDVLKAFDVLPTVNGPEIEPLERIHEFSNGAVIRGTGYPKVFVRQGCVMYPVDDHDLTYPAHNALNYGYDLMIDVPIGTVGVTTSREALELDESTRAVVKDAVATAIAEITDAINARFAVHTSRLAAVTDLIENGVAGFWSNGVEWKGEALNHWLYLEGPSRKHKAPAELLPLVKVGNKRGLSTLRQASYQSTRAMRFVIVHSTDKVVRAGLRYREFVAEHGDSAYQITDPSPRVLERLMRVWGIKRDQFVWIGDLDDPGPPVRGKASGGGVLQGVTTTSTYGNEVAELPDDYYWVNRNRPSRWDRSNIATQRAEVVKLGAEDLPVYIFSDTAVKRYKPDADKRLDAARKAALETQRDDIKAAYLHWAKWSEVNERVRVAFGADPVDYDLANRASDLFDYDTLSGFQDDAHAELADLKATYPMLFNPHDAQNIADYIAAVDKG